MLSIKILVLFIVDMVMNPNNHISQKFISREPGYNIFVLCNMESQYIRSTVDDYEILALDHPSVHFVRLDPIWSDLIRKNSSTVNSPIYLLYYQRKKLQVHTYSNFSVLFDVIEEIEKICDKN